jgi:hypothetical protein
LLTFDEYNLALAHVEKLLDRRQSTTSFYLSVNAGISAVIGFLFKDSQMTEIWLGSVLLLLCAGFIACWIWRSLLHQYEILIGWWYDRLRELEGSMPDSARLMTREYEELYLAAKEQKTTKQIGLTKRELILNWILTGLYTVFAIGIVSNLFIMIF